MEESVFNQRTRSSKSFVLSVPHFVGDDDKLYSGIYDRFIRDGRKPSEADLQTLYDIRERGEVKLDMLPEVIKKMEAALGRHENTEGLSKRKQGIGNQGLKNRGTEKE